MEVKIKPRNLVNQTPPIDGQIGGKGPTDNEQAQQLLNQGYIKDTNTFGKSEYEHREEAIRKGWVVEDD